MLLVIIQKYLWNFGQIRTPIITDTKSPELNPSQEYVLRYLSIFGSQECLGPSEEPENQTSIRVYDLFNWV